MDYKEKRNILRHIKLGIDEVFYINYDGEPLACRPISSFELDECFYHSLKYLSPRMVDIVIKLRLKLIKGEQEIDPPLTSEEYISLQKHYDTFSYWAVYYAMKDFQPDSFNYPIEDEFGDKIPNGIETLKKMKYIHDITDKILNASYQPKESLKEIISDETGREIGYIVYYLNVPLSDIKNITKLQRDYLMYVKGEIFKVKPKDRYMISGESMTMEDLLKAFGKDVSQYAER